MKYQKIFPILFLLTFQQSTCDVNYIGDCAFLLVEFATSAAEFMQCSIVYARPIHMCSSCVGSYNGVIEGHKKILEISESNNVTCKNRLINLDRLEIIEAGYSYVTQLWDKGRCPNCFDTDGGVPIHLSNTTQQFQKLYRDTETCFKQFINIDNGTYDTEVCRNCSSFYHKMNAFYDDMKIQFGDGHVCMDVVDAMNITQNLWSGDLHCGEELQKPEIPLITSCIIVLCLPLVFYLAAWNMSQTISAPVSKQKRLSKFIERWRSRSLMEGSMISQRRAS